MVEHGLRACRNGRKHITQIIQRQARGSVVSRKSRSRAATVSGRSIGMKWPAPSMISRRRVGHQLMCRVRVCDRNHTVAIAPDDHRRHGSLPSTSGRARLTRWPATSITARIVWTKARCASRVGEARVGVPDLARAAGRRGARACRGSGRPTRRRRGCAASARAAARTPTPGALSTRSSGLTSLPRPPLHTSTSRSQRSGNWYASCIAMPPPRLWPTKVARS